MNLVCKKPLPDHKGQVDLHNEHQNSFGKFGSAGLPEDYLDVY